jgi:hypothetical protein
LPFHWSQNLDFRDGTIQTPEPAGNSSKLGRDSRGHKRLDCIGSDIELDYTLIQSQIESEAAVLGRR